MQKEIENAIFSNVGNRLTAELAMGLVMTVLQVAQRSVEEARAAGLSAAAAMVPPAAAAAGPDSAGNIDPRYARDAAPAMPPAARPRRAAAAPRTSKARR